VKIVLDTNVLVAANAVPGLARSVFEFCLEKHDLVASLNLLNELAAALLNKLKAPPVSVAATIAFLKNEAVLFTPASIPAGACRDPDDLYILGLAVAAEADCIITGDEDLIVLGSFQKIPILSPRAFWDKFRPTKSTVHETVPLRYRRAGQKKKS
jgi:putative PIN family toxin of toxin-antitoxin system